MRLKRFSLILIVLIYAFTCIPVLGYNETNAANTTYDEMLGTLVALGIVGEDEVEDFTPDTNVTRAQLVVMVMRLLQTDSVGLSKEFDSFYDVPPEHEAYNEILMAYNMGIISGVDRERFDPQGIVSYEQAVKILVSALGYDQPAKEKGGYPEGYIAVATRAELLKGVKVENKAALTHKSVVQMVYNALETDLFDGTYYYSDGDHMSQIQEGTTLLKDRLDVKTVRGTVTQNDITGIGSVSSLSENLVMINGEVYSVGDTAIADYLGYNVKVYYKDDPIKEIIYFSHTEKYNNVLSIGEKEDLNISYSGGTFTFNYTDENGKKQKITSSGSCIYNGVYTDKIQTADTSDVDVMADIAGKSLAVKLIDNNYDNNYEVIILDAYEAFLVNNSSASNERLRYYTFGADRTMNLTEINISDDNDVEYTVYDADGNRTTLDIIEPKDTVSIYRDLSQKRYTLRVSKKKITGEILEMSDDGEYTLRVEDDSIVTSEGDKPTFEAAYTVGKTFPKALLRLGLYTTFYLDTEGNIAAYEMGNSLDGSYGLILDYDEVYRYPQFKILTSDGTTVILDAEKKITAYNPHTGKVEKTAVSDLVGVANSSDAKQKYYLWLTNNESYFDTNAESAATDNAKQFYYRPWLSNEERSDIASRKMVYYKTNADGRISTILVPDIPDTVDSKYRKLTLMNAPGRYGYTYVSGAYLAYDPNAGDDSITGGKDYIKLAEDATIFSGIALDYSEYDFNVRDIKVLNATTTKMWMYSVEGSAEARIVLRYTPLPREWASSLNMVVVKSVIEQNDGSYQLKGYSKGAEYVDTILPNTRLVERQLSSSSSSYVPIKQTDIKNYIATAYGGAGSYCYDYSTYAGATHQYADNESIKRGDILLVGKDYRTGICYVEVAMRAENCVQLFPSAQSSFVGRLKSKSIQKGFVTGFTTTGEILVNTVGQYHKNAARTTTPPANYKLVENGKVGSFYYDKHMPYNFTNCKSVWIYDYSSQTMEAATYSDIMIGDILMVNGSALAPLDCIILRNNPNEPSFDYWNETPVIPDTPDEPATPPETLEAGYIIYEKYNSYNQSDSIEKLKTDGTVGGKATYTLNGNANNSFTFNTSDTNVTDTCIKIPYAGVFNRSITIDLKTPIDMCSNVGGDPLSGEIVVEWDMMFKSMLDQDFFTIRLMNDTAKTVEEKGCFGLKNNTAFAAGTFHTCKIVLNKADWTYKMYIGDTLVKTVNAQKDADAFSRLMIFTQQNNSASTSDNVVYIDNLRISERASE